MFGLSPMDEVSSDHVPSERTALEELFRNAESNEGSIQNQVDSGTDEVESDERARRLAKNREHARSCRARKKVMIQSLRQTVSSLSDENQDLKTKNETLQSKVRALETTLVEHIQKLNAAQIPTNVQSNNNNQLQALIQRQDIMANLLKNSSANIPLPSTLPSHENSLLQHTNNLANNLAANVLPSNIPSALSQNLSQNLGMFNLLASLQKSRIPPDATQPSTHEMSHQVQDIGSTTSLFNGQQ